MTLRQFLITGGFLTNPTAAKACCPFHEDRTPSAMIHDDDNTLWCYACRRLYVPRDFRVKFKVTLDEVAEASPVSPEFAYEWGEPLFFA